jgi:putative glycosyltransferase (TIGR04348 family)
MPTIATKPHCIIVTPALAAANNGNWHTARRWQYYASKQAKVTLRLQLNLQDIDDFQAGIKPLGTKMIGIALHALRSAPSIQALRARGVPTALVLTGTDLYRDIQSNADAQRSLELASLLVVLNEQGIEELPIRFHGKTRCIFQSAAARKRLPLRKNTTDFAFVGHLRREKDPVTPCKAMQLLNSPNLRLRMAGNVHPSAGGVDLEVRTLAQEDTRIQLLGGVPQARARRLIAQSRALIVSSVMEGGANVLIEAVTAGVPILASRMGGNIGMLGKDYPGYFPVGDHKALAALMHRLIDDPSFEAALQNACAARSALFTPAAERAGVQGLVSDLLLGL